MNRMQGGRGGTFRPPTNPGVGLLGHGPGGDDHMAQGGEGFRKMGGGMSSDPYRQVGGDQRQKPAMDGGMGQMRGGGMRSEMDRRPMEYSQEIDRRPMEYNQEVDHRPMGRTQEMDRRPMGRNQEIDRRPMEYSQEMDRRPMGHNQEVGRSQLDNQDGGMGSMRGGMDRPSMGRSQDLERRPMGRDSEMDHRPMGRELEMERRPMGRESDVDRRPMGRDSNMDRQPMGRDSDMDRRPMGRGLEMDRPMGRGAEMDRRPMGRGQMNTRGGGALGRGGGGDMDRRPMSRDHIDSHGGGAMGRGGGGDMDRRPMSRDHIDSHGVGSQMRGGSMRDEPQSLDTRRGDDRQMDRPRMDNQGGGMRSGPPKREPMVDSRSMDTTGQYDRGRTDSQGPGMRGDPDRRPPPKMGGHGNRPEMGAGMRDNPPPRDPMMDRRTGPMGQGRRPDGLNSRGNIPDRASGSVTSMDIGGRSMEQRPGFMDRRTDDGNQTAYPDQQRTLNDRQESFVGTTPQHFVDTPMNLPIIPQQQQMDSLITADQFTGMVYNVEQPNMNMLEQQLAQARRELVQRQQQAAALEAVQLNREKEEAMLRATMLQAQQKLKRSSRNEGPRGDGLLGSGPTGGRMPPPGAGRGGPGRGRPPPSLLNMPPMGRGKRLGIAADRFDDSKKPRREPPSTDRRPSNTAPQRPSRRDQQQDGARRKTRFDSSPLSKTRDRKDSDKSSSSQATSKGKDSVTSKAGATKAVVKDKSKETAVTITFSEQYDPTEPTGDIPGDTEEEPMDEDVKEAVKTEAGADKPKEMSLTVTINKKGRSVNDADKKPEVKKVLKCNICDVVCYDEMAFSRHMKSPRHLQKMQSVIDMSTQKTTQVLARKQAEQHLRSLETPTRPQPQRMPDGKTFESFCKTCEQNYTGAFKLHKETKMHKARDERRKAGCKICPVRTFNNYEDFAKHLQSTWHKKNKEKSKLSEDDEDLNEMVTLDTVGFEDDSAVGHNSKKKDGEKKSAHAKLPVTPFEKKALSTSTPKVSVSADVSKLDSSDCPMSPMVPEEITIPDVFDPDVPVGQHYVVPVSGYFCKLCHKFYNNEMTARTNHCQSQAHFDKFQKAMIAKAYSKRMKEESVVKEESVAMESQSEALSPISKQNDSQSDSVTINTSQQNGTTEDAKNESATVEEEPKGEAESVLEESGVENPTTMSCYETADESTDQSQEDDGKFLSMQESQGSDMDETKVGGDVESPVRGRSGMKARGSGKAVRSRGRGRQAKRV